jgi:hypothetical protein
LNGQDQPAFRRCLWQTGATFYVLGPEYNWRPFLLSFLCGRAKIIHNFYDGDYDKLGKVANNRTGARILPNLL